MDSSITKTDSKALKGIAVLMMVAMHILKAKWMLNPGGIIDVSGGGTFLSHVLAEALHASTAIFAFLSGYACAKNNVSLKHNFKKALALYISYWVVTLCINLPLSELNEFVLTGSVIQFNLSIVVKSILALSSQISTYCWYIPFFALAILTYPFLYKFTRKWKNVYFQICAVIGLFLLVRVIIKVLSYKVPIDSELLGVVQNYNTTMPCWMIGAVVYGSDLYAQINKLLHKYELFCAIGFMILLTIFRIFLQFVVGIQSNLNFIWILLEMWALIIIVKKIDQNHFVGRILTILGEYSLYIWLIHAVFKLPTIQPFTYRLRVPVLIVMQALLLSLLLAVPIKALDIHLKKILHLDSRHMGKEKE